MDKYLITRKEIVKTLARDDDELEGYDATIFGLIWDGEQWEIYEDSLEEDEALEWAARAAGYGEHVGLYKWEGAA